MKYYNQLVNPNLPLAFAFTPKEYSNPDQQKGLKTLKEAYPSYNISLKTPLIEHQAPKLPSKFAEVYFLIDVSGSITKEHKEHFAGIAEGILYTLGKTYEEATPTYIAFHVNIASTARDLSWLENKETGGTVVSSALKETSLSSPNDTYIVILTDGDNWHDDNPTVERLLKEKALEGFAGFKYFEVTDRPTQPLGKVCKNLSFVSAYKMPLGELVFIEL
jgi:uncharacterized sporulation protein YeaH/YhbH (DUF444 family)